MPAVVTPMSENTQLHRNAGGRHPKKTRAPKPSPVTVTQVHRGIWAEAMKIAGNDPKRITIISATKVEIV